MGETATAVLEDRQGPVTQLGSAARSRTPPPPSRSSPRIVAASPPSTVTGCAGVTLTGDASTIQAGLVPSASLTWEEAYRTHADFVWRNLRRMGLTANDAEDALHEVFLILHKRHESFDPSRGSLRSWLFGIAANIVRSERRKQLRTEPHAMSDDGFVGRTSQQGLVSDSSWRAMDGQATASSRELKDAIGRAIDELPPEHRAVFVMFEIEGADCTGIAADLGVPVGTVYSRLHTARRHLKDALVTYHSPSAPSSSAQPDGARAVPALPTSLPALPTSPPDLSVSPLTSAALGHRRAPSGQTGEQS